MEVWVLGPVEARHDDAVVRFARRQQRLVLGILALQPNRAVPGERLIDLLWGQQPPARARAVLQSRISELRATLAAMPRPDPDVRVDTTATGYVLETPPERIDAHRFEELVARGRAARTDEERRALLRQALALWRGPVLGDSAPTGSHAGFGTSLEAARLTAAEDLLDAELRLDNHYAIADEALRLANEHPTRERFIGHMLLALSRTGRAAEALQAYHSWRGWLRDELGTDPSPEVQATHTSVLQGTSPPVGSTRPSGGNLAAATTRLDGPDRFTVTVPRTLPPDIADFAGRQREVRILRDLLLHRRTGQVAIAAVTGPGGAGKTALAVHVGHAVAAHFPDGQLYVNLRGNDHDEPVEPFEVLGRFLRLLGVDGLAVPGTVEERADLYRSLLSDRSAIVLLDNAASDEQLLPLVPNSATCGVLVTGRSHLGASLGVRPLHVDVMDETDALELLRRVGGPARVADDPAATADLARRCGYLPLALRIVAAKLSAKPHWSVDKVVGLLDDEQERLDRLSHGHLDVRASIALSYEHLRPAARTLLRHLGDFDLPEVSVWLSAALLDCRSDAAEELLEQLLDAQLLQLGTDPDGRTRYRLHDLVRIFARERAAVESPDDELEAARVRGFGTFLRMLDLLLRAINGGDYRTLHGPATRWPVDDRWATAAEAELLDWFDAERSSVVAAVRRAARDGRSATAWDLACAATIPLTTRRQYDDMGVVLEAALTATLRAGDLRGEAATRHRLGVLHGVHRRIDATLEHLQRAAELFEQLGDVHGQALVSSTRGIFEVGRGRPEDAIEHFAAALAGLRTVNDHGEIAQVLRSIGRARMQLGDDDAADSAFESALTVLRKTGGSATGQAQVLFWRGMLWLRQGRHTIAEPLFQEVLALTRVLGDRTGQAQALRGLGICHVQRGDRAAGRAALDDALHLVRRPSLSIVESQVRGTIAQLFDGHEDDPTASSGTSPADGRQRKPSS
ncbi:BTAD domain-containing putative transcriptional regulator [Actinomycetes bacterium KLBMP 9797]